MGRTPGLGRWDLLPAPPAAEIVPPALQLYPPAGTKANSTVRAIHLLLHDEVTARELAQGHGIQVFIALLDARAFDMLCAWIFMHLVHGRSILATTTIWFNTYSTLTRVIPSSPTNSRNCP